MRSERGVSEVIGTILILAMTVVLFASIIMWVSSIPTPQASIRLDMDGQLSPIYDINGNWTGANFTVQHRGGETLDGFGTSIFFIVQHDDGSFDTESLKTRGSVAGIPYGIDGPDLDWDAGEVWKYTNYSVEPTDKVTLSVVDNPSSIVVWTEQVRGPEGTHPPIFVEKWLDGDTSTAITRDTPLTGLPFGLYAKIEDPDGDLKTNNVSAKYTFGPHATFLMYDDATHGDRVADDGIFSLVDPDILPVTGWDGRIIILKAEDLLGHVTESRLIFQVLQNPNEPPPATTKTGPEDLLYHNEFQAFGIFNDSAWDLKKWAANETRTFKKNEWVVVIVASQYLRNVNLQNDFMMYDPNPVPQVPLVYSNAPYNRPVTSTSAPSTTQAFTFLEETDGYSVFEYRFRTESGIYGHDGVQLDVGQYHIEITLRASSVSPPRNQFTTVDALTVTNANGTAPDYPIVEFFRDSGHTQKTIQFNFTDNAYVRVKVLTTDGSVTAGDVTVSDYIGGVQIWARPGTVPIGAISTNGSRYYKFTIDLSKPNRDSWVNDNNAYGFRIKFLRDVNEDFTLSAQFLVNGPRWTLDIASAIQEYVYPALSEKWYSVFNYNDHPLSANPWSTTLIEKHTPSTTVPPWGGGRFYANVLSDLDEDGDLDVAVGLESGGYVWWYRNLDGRGRTWEKTQIDNPGNQVRSIAAGKLDQDLDNDIVAGYNTGQIYMYANDGAWSRSTIATLGAVVVHSLKIADADMDGDKDVIAACSDSRFRIYWNTGSGSYTGPFVSAAQTAAVFDIAVTDVDNDTDNDLFLVTGTNFRVYRGPAFTAFWSASTVDTALSIDVGLIDVGEEMDVVVGTNAGNLYWFRNQGGGAFTRTTIVTLAALDDILSLRVGDVDGDRRDDVVIGSQAGWIRWYRNLATPAAVTWDVNRPAVLTVTTNVHKVDIGDVDRGVVIDRSK